MNNAGSIQDGSIKREIRRFRWRLDGRELPFGVGCAWLSAEDNRDGNIDLLLRCYESGARFFDTSRDYGESELMVGGMLRRIDRGSVFIATKCDFHPEKPDAFETFKRRFYESFERLGVDYIDLYQAHDTNDFSVTLPEVMPFLRERREEGLIRHIGLGTRSLAAHMNAIACGQCDSALSYMDYNLLKRAADPLIALAASRGCAFLNASVLLFGLLKSADPMTCRPMDSRNIPGTLHRAFAVKTREMCSRLGIDIIAASLQYPMLNPDIDITLNGIRRPSNLESTLKALREPLHAEQWAAIEELQRTHPMLRIPDEHNF
ncbi:MAG: aldo/keto reductase [Oscillospiraceae bacterium]|jgi:D-threo-aldose 1-dehydrogenase|nr:aldo/keto reductase [Oscillospiraceae bacterium]